MNLNDSGNLFEEARLLMPWYLTNKLSMEQKSVVDQALLQYPELQEEFAREEKIMQLVHDNVSLLDLSAVDTSKQRFDKLMRRIDREEELSETGTVSEVQPFFIKQIYHQVTTWMASLWNFNFAWPTPVNTMVFAALVVLQLALVGVYFTANNFSSTPTTPTSFVSASDNEPDGTTKDNLLLVEFKSKAEYGQVANFLEQYHAKIVDGPIPNNLFKIQVNTLSLGMDIDATMAKMSADDNAPAKVIGRYFNK